MESTEMEDEGPRNNSNINSSDIDEEIRDKLKGDLIGDTMYSESFIIKTMLRFNNMEWTTDFENDLCFIWDMTMEEAVCDYLFKISFPSLACNIINSVNENRLIEILIGILGNICIPKSTPELKLEIVSDIVKYIKSDDHLILIQVVRFIKVVSYKSQSKLLFLNNDLMDKIIFILKNSVIHELLEVTLDALAHVTTRDKINSLYFSGELIESTCDAIETVNSDTDKIKVCLNHWLKIFVNFCVQINETNNVSLLNSLNDSIDDILKIICFELMCCFNEDDVESCLTELEYIIQVLVYVCPVLNFQCDKMFFILLDGFSKLLHCKDIVQVFGQNYVEVLCFFISTFDIPKFKQQDNIKYLDVLNYVKNCEYDCDYDYVYNLNYMISVINK